MFTQKLQLDNVINFIFFNEMLFMNENCFELLLFTVFPIQMLASKMTITDMS